MKRFLTLLLVTLSLLLANSDMLKAQSVTVRVSNKQTSAEVQLNIEAEAARLLSTFNESILDDGKKLKDKLRLQFPGKTPESKKLIKSIMDLWDQSPISCCVSEVESPLLELYGRRGFQMREIPVNVLDADLNNAFKDLVITFDATGHITEVNMALEKHNYNEVILNGIKPEDLACRQMILDFIEVFRTAYNRKDIDYLEQVYSPDALIITGVELRKKDKKDDHSDELMMKGLGGTRYRLVVQDKQQYIAKLRDNFKRTAWFDIKFDNVSVHQHPKHEQLYGVTLKQYWNTSGYSDVGWLFLMINFEDPTKPSIEVRTWQPEMFQGRTISRDEVFSFDNFNI